MELLILVGAALAAVCFANSSAGMLIVVAAGFVQDPLRKLAPGAPVVFVVLVLGFYLAVFAGMLSRGGLARLVSSRVYRQLRPPLLFFMAVVALQSLNAYARTGNPVLPAIGFLSYVAPAVAGAVGFVLASNTERFLGFLRAYMWWGLAASSTILAARFYPDVELFRPVGTGLMVYGENLGVQLASGALRTPETAAWHAATTGCVLLLLLSLGRAWKRARVSLLAGAAGVVLTVLAIIWTGRRKALIEVALFLVVYGLFLLRLRGANRRLLWALALGGGLFAYQVLEGAFAADSSREAAYLLSRGGGTASEGGARVLAALRSVPIALERNGALGLGAGVVAQGSQYFGGGGIAGWEAEYGVGRLATELGLPGLVGIVWIAVRLGRILRRGFGGMVRFSQENARVAFGLLALLLANAAVFVTAAQVFGDPFVYLMLGTIAGGLGGMIELSIRRESETAAANLPLLAA